jgi:hypothetical protein
MKGEPILHRFKLRRLSTARSNLHWRAILAALAVLVVIAAISGFISPGFAQTRSMSKPHIYNDSDAKIYSLSGLPRSTAPISGLPQSKSQDPLQQLDRIERQSVIAFKATSEPQRKNNLRQTTPPKRSAFSIIGKTATN